MNWKETLIKSSEIKWKRITPKSIDDGKLDFNLHIPLTALFESQAKLAFAKGMITMLEFHIKKQTDNTPIEVEDLIKLFNEMGLPELAQQFSVSSSERSSP